MEGSPRKHGMYYRCLSRTLAPGSPALAEHPATVYVREEPLRDGVNGWIGSLFAPENVDDTVRQLVGAQDTSEAVTRAAARTRLREAQAELRRFQAAIAAGVDPAGLVEPMNTAQAERAAAEAELNRTSASVELDRAEVYAMIDSLGDVGAALGGADRQRLADLYGRLDLRIAYNERETTATITPRVNNAGVRGGT
ncbi:MAG: hypothetical protein M3R63_19535 [Actinomycetota bacterium]|nr:hypothetical protein [Actinomycetota bacterium]